MSIWFKRQLLFYKNIFSALPAVFYGFYNMMSGRLLVNVWMTQTFNTAATAFPIVVFGILDNDVEAEAALKYPSIQRRNQWGVLFRRIAAWWMGLGFLHAAISYMLPTLFYNDTVDG